MSNCRTCELVAQRDEDKAPLWDAIVRTENWDLVHCYNTSLSGWLVLVPRRHIAAIDEMNDAETAELGPLLRQASSALKEITGCLKTYVIQFAEHPDHPHVHFHIVPRMADQPDDRRGRNIFEYLGVPEDERISDDKMNEIALQIRQIFNRTER